MKVSLTFETEEPLTDAANLDWLTGMVTEHVNQNLPTGDLKGPLNVAASIEYHDSDHLPRTVKYRLQVE